MNSNQPKRILTIFGTRPEAIKVAPLITALKKDPRFECSVIFTGQHKEMVLPIMDWFDIKPDHTLSVMEHKQPLARLSGKLLNGLHEIIEETRPDTVMVQGDTTSTFMAALTAYYGYDYYVRNDLHDRRRKIEIAHIEAGLRTYDNYAPFPEEANRRMVGHLATHHFAPTLTAATALYDENITDNVFITGNTVIDALFETVEMLKTKPLNPLPQLPENARFVLITGHRRENYGDGFDNICKAIKTLAHQHPETFFVYPVHLNQHVHNPVMEHLDNTPNIILTDPLDYPNFIALMQRCHLVLTDSGGLQEEAPSLGKPVLVMRDVTERPDAVMAGTAKIVGTQTDKIITETNTLLTNNDAYTKMAEAINPYGDGLATQRILNILAGQAGADNIFDASVALKAA
ncbi:MAG: UDP-N-acetylglucosamine 2-epimerase (non-hydrolyzing) [Alphaproteobacteria bacterium]|nr:UDP-N-acetylglucosamine 2-epimerase (non-hydrolyzing) [Alphaproteobacteria bacterium]MDD9919964.1 UDP-N-acetylglucosamine 2-epimerase (non-hydrolyzing) [Alphaproteobacteria bacterium]